MKIGAHDLDNKILIIAEIGNNHEGHFSLAEDLIGKAAESGVDAVKFQTYNTEAFIDPEYRSQYQKMKTFELTPEDFVKLSRLARSLGLLFISTPFNLSSIAILGEITDALKIASGDNTFPQLIEEVAQTGKPIIMSTGFADLAVVQAAANLIEDVWHKSQINPGLVLLHCIASYPTANDATNLKAIQSLIANFPNLTIGYSDHTIGIDAAVAAVALGARVIEKHFTVDNNFSEFRDHQLSANPQTLKAMVEQITKTSLMLGNGEVELAACERTGISSFRRSAFAAADLESDREIGVGDILWMRPGRGIPPNHSAQIIGRRVNRRIGKLELIRLEDLI